jgi:hypothetical protein
VEIGEENAHVRLHVSSLVGKGGEKTRALPVADGRRSHG